MSKDTLPKLVDTSLDTLLTPQSLIRLHAEGKSLRELINSAKSGGPDLAGQVGGFIRDLFGTSKAPDTAPDAGPGKPPPRRSSRKAGGSV